jgi:polyisoprenoid-binding protein YceI
MKLLKAGLISIMSASAIFAGTYTLDKPHSSVGFKVKHMMVSNTKGNFTEFDGTFEYDEKSNTLKSLSGVVNTASINTDNEKRDKHLKSPDFFDAEKYPEIKFEMKKLVKDKLYGTLTMKGITKDIEFDYENGGSAVDAWGNNKAGFSFEGKINRKDFGLTWNKILEAGGVAVGEDVKIEIEIEGNLKEEEAPKK